MAWGGSNWHCEKIRLFAETSSSPLFANGEKLLLTFTSETTP